jgi:hypothetical protein
MRIHQLTAAAIPIALLLGGCGDRQDEARNAADESTASALASRNRQEEPAELTAAAVEAHVKTMVEGLGDVKIVEASPGHFMGTGSLDGSACWIAAFHGNGVFCYRIESVDGFPTIREYLASGEMEEGNLHVLEIENEDGIIEESVSDLNNKTIRSTTLKPARRSLVPLGTILSEETGSIDQPFPTYQEILRKMVKMKREFEENP